MMKWRPDLNSSSIRQNILTIDSKPGCHTVGLGLNRTKFGSVQNVIRIFGVHGNFHILKLAILDNVCCQNNFIHIKDYKLSQHVYICTYIYTSVVTCCGNIKITSYS